MSTDQYAEWFSSIKRELLVSEPLNIAARAQCCQNLVNEAISSLNTQLGLEQLESGQQYKCNVDARAHLKFLINWPGLRIGSDSAKAPRSKREYEKKAKNWLNGRRAPNYGRTLFPHFISEAEQYSNKVTKFLISGNNTQHQQSLYYKILIYKILAQLCGCSVSLNEQAKKAPFFCKNSIERKGKLKEILQAYAFDHQYIQGFPSCFEEAIDYFENKSNRYFAQYRDKYLVQKKIDNDGDTVIESDHDHEQQQNTKRIIPEFEEKKCEPSNFWKAKVIELEQQLEIERKRRNKVEKERNALQSILNLMQQNLNLMNNPQQINNMMNMNNMNNNNPQQTPHNMQQYGIIATPAKQFNADNIQNIQSLYNNIKYKQQQNGNQNNNVQNIAVQPLSLNHMQSMNAYNNSINTVIPNINMQTSMNPNVQNMPNLQTMQQNQIGEQMAASLFKILSDQR